MEVEEEAVCAMGIQSVMVDGEQGVGVNVKRIPLEILFSKWVRVFLTTCGYEFPLPMGGGGKAHESCKHLHETSKTTLLILDHVRRITPFSA